MPEAVAFAETNGRRSETMRALYACIQRALVKLRRFLGFS